MPSLKTGQDAARRRFWLAMSGFVMALALLPFSYKVERSLETAVHIKGGESEKVGLELAQRFQSPYAHRLVLVISGIPDPDSAKGADALGFLTSSLRSLPGVSGAVSSLDWPDALFTGNNGGALIIVGLDPHDETVEALVPKLRARADWWKVSLGRYTQYQTGDYGHSRHPSQGRASMGTRGAFLRCRGDDRRARRCAARRRRSRTRRRLL